MIEQGFRDMPLEPNELYKSEPGTNGKYVNFYCPNCGCKLDITMYNCPRCYQAIKWHP